LQPNHPQYQNQYYFLQQSESLWEVGFLAKQVQTNSGFFKMPIEFKIHFETGADTTIRVMNDVNNQQFYYYFNRRPLTVQFDPSNNIVLKEATLTQVPPLPVELTSFTAEAKDNFIVLKWNTATETNNKGFEVERLQDYKILKLQDLNSKSEIRNPQWQFVGYVDGKGTTTTQQFYDYIDYVKEYSVYHYRLKQIDFDGSYEYSNEIAVQGGLRPEEYMLWQNYPNPFNPQTTIKLSVPKTSIVKLSVYNSLGELVKVLTEGTFAAGDYSFEFNGKDLSSGIYIYEMKTSEITLRNKLVLQK
jgi:Secretion system C-terminal sorting domain